MNVIFGVTLTFIGGFSIAGVLGAKEIIHVSQMSPLDNDTSRK